jgi:hypothetical protein
LCGTWSCLLSFFADAALLRGKAAVAACQCLPQTQVTCRENPRAFAPKKTFSFPRFSMIEPITYRKNASIFVRGWTRRCAKKTRGRKGGRGRARPPTSYDGTAQKSTPSREVTALCLALDQEKYLKNREN